MGRRKIAIQPIAHERNRSVTFAKRKHGLFKKAYELGVLCSVDIAVIIFEERPSHRAKLYQYCSSKADDVVRRQLHHDGEKETRGPADFVQSSARKYEDVEIEDFDYVSQAYRNPYPYHISSGHSVPTIHRQHGQHHVPYDPLQRQRERPHYQEDIQRTVSSYSRPIPQPQGYTNANVYQSNGNSAQENSHYARVAQSPSYSSPQSSSPAQGSEYSQLSRARSISGASSSGGMYPPPRTSYRSLDSTVYAGSRNAEDYAFSDTRSDPRRPGTTTAVSSGRAGLEWPPLKIEQQPCQHQQVGSDGSMARGLGRERLKSCDGTGVDSPSVGPVPAPGPASGGTHWLDFLAGATKSNTNGDITATTRGEGVASMAGRSISWESESSSGSRGGTCSGDEAMTTMAVDGLALFDMHGG